MSENLNLHTIDTVDTSPFKKMVITIGELPTSFVESMTYYEALAWLVKYLQDTVIPAVNNNAEATTELQSLFTTLYNYVHDYFENLDVQEEINNKLDEMAEDGTLQEIITSYIQSNVAWTFDNVEDMKSAENLVNGSYAQTLGYHNKNDGGKGLYKIRTITNDDTVDEGFIISLNDDTLIAELIINDIINIKQLGAYGDDEHDDSNAIKLGVSSDYNVYIPNGTYKITEAINLPENTQIKGEDKFNTIISRSNTTSPNTIFNFTGNGKVIVKNIGLECNATVDYGFLANTNISKFTLEDININQPATSGIYTDKSTYLGQIIRARITNSSGTGIYLVPTSTDYTNTSINLSGCYCSECQNAYKITGNYMNMDNCCCDGIYNICYDLRGYIGSLISCGSEAYTCNYMFYGDQFTNATVVNAKTFASYDNANSVHIFTGINSTWVFIGGFLAAKYRSELDTGLGKFLEQSASSHIKFIGSEVRGTFAKPSDIIDGFEWSDENGTISSRGDVNYLGYRQTNFGSTLSGKNIPSSAIYMGVNNAPQISTNGYKITSRGVNTGDMFITKTPNKIGGAGWISNTDIIGQPAGGNYSKIPVVNSGATGSEPTRALVVGDMYFDTTLVQPKWCTNIGRQEHDTISITTPPTTAGNIILTFNGTNYQIPVTVGMTKSELYAAMMNANIEGMFIEEYGSSVSCTAKDYKTWGGAMLSIDPQSTGMVVNISRSTTGLSATWKSLSEF